ncbi:ABC transporter permease [Rhabdobacter roseus]|uniref:Putative ABC transport system permease protein n=1 Tax=Rhabdobacter roseus TaxID=1655419 RepID=A0A840U0H4_9BACT|nr:ABC transporter permease [Rhabdobacter roseus]MBB5285640.1 putative ABC transport system permease protein [Rhabdobacter roseus]
MLRNYLKIAVRSLLANKLFSTLNIVGLTVGLAVSSFIAMYVWHELHYDRFQPLANQMYRIISLSDYGGEEVRFASLHESFGPEVQKQVPEVLEVMRYNGGMLGVLLQTDENHRFKEEKIGFADAPALALMGGQMRYGNLQTALAEPGQIVLTRPLAEKYFGPQNPLGQVLTFDKHYPLTVSGVLEDLPTNSVFQFNALVSLSSMPSLGPNRKGIYESAGFLETFVVLRPGADPEAVAKKITAVKAGIKFASVKDKNFLEPLSSLHLGNKAGNRQTLYVFLAVALLVLSLAIINYLSLTTARATKRAREVGVRKAVGSQRRELIGQFFTESFLTTTLAFVLSLVLLQLLFPWASRVFDLRMDQQVLRQGMYWGLLLGLWLVCSLLAGAYPALLLSNFQPQDVLKGTLSTGRSGSVVRRVFTTLQFTAAVGLLICCAVLAAQMRYLHTTNLGIDRAQVVAVNIDEGMSAQFPVLRDELRQWAGAENVAVSQAALFTPYISTYFLKTDKTQKDLMVKVMSVDENFIKMMGVQWKVAPEGWGQKPLTRELSVYNETVLKEAGIPTYDPAQPEKPFKSMEIDGVFADFNVGSLHAATDPMMLSVLADTSRALYREGTYLLVRLNARTEVPKALAELKAIYDRHQPQVPFDYYFLDDAYHKLYAKEERLARLFNGFAGLTILVACLGLLGLITFAVETRAKEIGIRKVLGASVESIVLLLSRDFMKLLLVAIVLASPLAYYFMEKWLQNFAYRIDIAWWMLAGAAGVTVMLALLTVSVQSIRAALMNPVKSLRSE